MQLTEVQREAIKRSIAMTNDRALIARDNAANHLRCGNVEKGNAATARSVELFKDAATLNSILEA